MRIRIELGGGTGIGPPDSFSYRSNFRFSSSFRFRSRSSSCCTTSGDIFYCSGSRQLNQSTFLFVCPSRYDARHRKPRRFVYALNLGGTGISPPGQKSPRPKVPRPKVPPGKRPPGKSPPGKRPPGQKSPRPRTPNKRRHILLQW